MENYTEFCTKFQLRNCFLQFNGLLMSIKKLLKYNTKYENIDLKERPSNNFNNTCFRTVEKDTIIDIKKAKCKTYYDILIYFKLEEPTALLKWKQENEIEDETFYNSFKHARMSTHETRLYMFQYKLNHRLINNNCNLQKWNIKDSPYCSLCNDNNIDDTYHAMVECRWTFDTLKLILDEIDPNRAWARILDIETWILGVADKAVNCIIMIIKQYLCQVRSGSKRFSMQSLKNEIYLRIVTEKKYSNLLKFQNKWVNHIDLVHESEQYGMLFNYW